MDTRERPSPPWRAKRGSCLALRSRAGPSLTWHTLPTSVPSTRLPGKSSFPRDIGKPHGHLLASGQEGQI